MSKTVQIQSDAQLQSLISSTKVVVTDFHADWCAPCKQIAPVYEQLSEALSRPKKVVFTKVDVDARKDVAQRYGITAMPTFMVFKNGAAVQTVKGADPRQLKDVVQKLAAEADADGGSGGFGEGSSSSASWIGRDPPRGYSDITDQVDVRGLDLLNADAAFGTARGLFAGAKPAALDAKGKAAEGEKDWVESDTDEQLMLYMPFQSTLKVHTLQLTSCSPEGDVMRPKTLQLYSNRAHVLGFDEAEDIPATQTVVLGAEDWDAATQTAKVELRFVKFQNVTSLVLFVVDGDGEGERVRIDRIRIVGDTGEKRDMGKLEKVGDEHGE